MARATIPAAGGRMFEHELLERLSRIPPWQPPVVYGPLIAYLAWRGLTRDGDGGLAFAALAMAGIAGWTLLEYALHRTLFHYRASSRRGARLFWIMHGVHHDWPQDARRLVFPPSVSIPIAIGIWLALGMLAGGRTRVPVMAGFVTGYLLYDMLHYWIHHGTRGARLIGGFRRHHLHHHFRDGTRAFGVSSPLWDYVFGTLPVRHGGGGHAGP
jgi:sterol desaturase/sphingolipid hydroxylase (fatty acid hydroxylase superfamily)